MDTCRATCLIYFFERGVGFCVEEIVHERCVKQDCVLRHHADLVSQRAFGDISDVVVIDEDGTTVNIVESEKKFQTCGFAAPTFSYNGRCSPWIDGKGDVIERGFAWIVGEIDV